MMALDPKIRVLVDRIYEGDNHYMELAGPSTATKPEGNIITGSVYIQVGGTSIKAFFYNEEGAPGSRWEEA